MTITMTIIMEKGITAMVTTTNQPTEFDKIIKKKEKR
jgi:hypothetical protein